METLTVLVGLFMCLFFLCAGMHCIDNAWNGLNYRAEADCYFGRCLGLAGLYELGVFLVFASVLGLAIVMFVAGRCLFYGKKC